MSDYRFDGVFDEIIPRRGTHSMKWDMMEARFGVCPRDGLAMWVADMDFRPPPCVLATLTQMVEHGIYGYPGGRDPYHEAIRWWMQTRHGWSPEADHIFTTHGLVNGVALCVDAFTAPGDGVVMFTPIYHSFAPVLRAGGRRIVELELARTAQGRYGFDFSAYDAQMTGSERMLILCSPHNPNGRVWSRAELQAVAAFARRHDLIVVSDEIHHDLVYPGQTHTPMTTIDGVADRLVMLTAASKTFNIAGGYTGNVIIADDALRSRFATRIAALGISSANGFGMAMARAAYCAQGAAWLDALMAYLDGNRRLFDEGIGAIAGAVSTPLEATYLAWVDFSGTGLNQADVSARIQQRARIAANQGPTFGKGGEGFVRFNLATPRARVAEAVERLQAAFSDL